MSRVLIYDIETAPILGAVWGKYEQDLVWSINDWYILSFAYKWHGEKKTHVVTLPEFKTYKRNPEDDSELVKKLHELFDEADVVIAHNGNRFDQKKSQARMILNGLKPPSPYKQIDTLQEAKKHFAFTSNRLDDLGDSLGLGRKVQTGGFRLWRDCMAGDMKAWAKLAKYNKQDVVLLEKVYLALRPWIKNHPSLSLLAGRPEACPKCSGTRIQKRGRIPAGKVSFKQRYQCMDCGGWLQGRPVERSDVHYVN